MKKSNLFILSIIVSSSQLVRCKPMVVMESSTENDLDYEGSKDFGDAHVEKSKQRIGRFFMDTTNAANAGSNLFDLGLDTNMILTGLLQPENIAIHVAQNAVNFVSSSLAWLALGIFASQTALSGRGIDPDILKAASEASSATSSTSIASNNILKPILIPNPSSSQPNSIMVPFMGREVKPPTFSSKTVVASPPSSTSMSSDVVKTLPLYNHKMASSSLLSNRNFVASIPYHSSSSSLDFGLATNDIHDDEEGNRRMEANASKPKKKMLRKIVKKVVAVKD